MIEGIIASVVVALMAWLFSGQTTLKAARAKGIEGLDLDD